MARGYVCRGMTTWKFVFEDKRFEDLPFKIETNARGQIIMSPTYFYHGSHAYRIARLLEAFLPDGHGVVKCSIATSDGVKEADVVWMSREIAQQAEAEDWLEMPRAPEICVEVLSPSNSLAEMEHKGRLFREAGAKEYWLCNKAGEMRFLGEHGESETSLICPGFPKLLPKR